MRRYLIVFVTSKKHESLLLVFAFDLYLFTYLFIYLFISFAFFQEFHFKVIITNITCFVSYNLIDLNPRLSIILLLIFDYNAYYFNRAKVKANLLIFLRIL